MGYTQIQSFLIKIKTFDNNILSVWNSLVDTLTRSDTGCVTEYRVSLGEISWMKYTTTITLHEKNNFLLKISVLSETKLPLAFLASGVFWEVLWITHQSSFKEEVPSTHKVFSTLRYMGLDVFWEEYKSGDQSIEKEDND